MSPNMWKLALAGVVVMGLGAGGLAVASKPATASPAFTVYKTPT